LFSLLYGSHKGGKSVFPSTKEGGIPIDYAAFYVVNAVTAIHHLHYHDIIHRDLKIENFVSD
jgi:serine/threonine protein kinase